MYLVAACSLTLRPLLAKVPFNSLKTKIGYGQNTKMTANTKGSVVKSGFIQMDDLHDERGAPKMDIMTSRSFKVDVESDVESARYDRSQSARSNY